MRPAPRRLPLALALSAHPTRRVGTIVAIGGTVASLLGGCGIVDSENRKVMAEQESILAPLFKTPTPVDAANWASDPYDADKRARGTTLLANAPFGGADPYLNLYREHLADPAPSVRVAGARGLSVHGSPEDVARLTPLLSDTDRGVRLETAKALQRLHNPAAVDPLIRSLSPKVEADEDVRGEVAAALGQYAETRVLQALIASLDDDSLNVARSALRSLRTLTGNDDLSDDRKAWFRWAATARDPFAERRQYVYPVFQRDKRWLDYVPFMPAVPNETPGTPAGMEAGVGSGAGAGEKTAAR